jgi:hypothetical protein
LAATDPVRRKRATHRIAELGLTSKAAAASWQDAPASTARTTRSRKSREYGFGIVVSRISRMRLADPQAFENPRRSASDSTQSDYALALQVETARRREQDLIPLTLVSSSVAASALGTALMVETKEAGPIAFRISLEEIANLRLTLAQLETFPDPQSRM